MSPRKQWPREAAARDLRRLLRGQIREDVPLARYTTYRVGGPADLFVRPAHLEDLVRLVGYVRERGISTLVLGKGANLLVNDRGFRGIVISLLRRLDDVDVRDRVARVGAGAVLEKVLWQFAEQGLRGLERLIGIPGTIGGAIHMNAGAFGQEIFDRVRRVQVVEGAGQVRWLDRGEIPFGYRRGLTDPDRIVTAVELELEAGNPGELREIMSEILLRRKRKQPLSYPSAGSVFKRPPGHYAGALIEQAGLKGAKIGGAMVSFKHANFILNKGGATAEDIYRLIRLIQETVYRKFGVQLELENELVGWDDGEAEPP